MFSKKDREIYDWFQQIRTGNLVHFINKHCGKLLGKGLYRDVYELKGDKDYVIKIQRAMTQGDFSNALEWNYYQRNEDWDRLIRWLAPAIAIDETSQILVQRRAIFKTIDKYPEKMPSIFSDFKIQNYGWIDKKFVCVDYAGLLLGNTLRLKRAKWWDVNDK
jgi:hypothetical protein